MTAQADVEASVVQTYRLKRYPSLVFVIDEAMPKNTCKVDKNGIGRCNAATWARMKEMEAHMEKHHPRRQGPLSDAG